MYLLLIFIIFIVICSGNSDLSSKERNFSLQLIRTGSSDHAIIGCFSLWTLLGSAAIWTHEDYLGQVSKTMVENKNSFIESYVKLRNELLNYESSAQTGVHIEFQNFIFANNDFDILPDFRDTMKTVFRAHITNMNFSNSVSSANDANDAVRRASPKSRRPFRPADFGANLTMIMANFMVFKADWASPFEKPPYLTSEEAIAGKEWVMHKKMNIPYIYLEQIKSNVMDLSFGSTGNYSMLIIKPSVESVNISEISKDLEENFSLLDIMNKLRDDVKEHGLKEVNVSLPIFQMDTTVVLNKPLEHLGLGDIFKPDDGHFPGISSDEIYVSSVEHKCNMLLRWNEVEIYASTPGHSSSLQPVYSTGNEPFIFFILKKPEVTVLFSGLYSKHTTN